MDISITIVNIIYNYYIYIVLILSLLITYYISKVKEFILPNSIILFIFLSCILLLIIYALMNIIIK